VQFNPESDLFKSFSNLKAYLVAYFIEKLISKLINLIRLTNMKGSLDCVHHKLFFIYYRLVLKEIKKFHNEISHSINNEQIQSINGPSSCHKIKKISFKPT